MRKKQIVSSLLLMLTALLWGMGFVAQSEGMKSVQPFTFAAARMILGGVVLLPFIPLLDKIRGGKPKRDKAGTRRLLFAGVCCGIALCIASNFQQIGIMYTTAGKAGFVTALYMVLVPILGIFIGRKTGKLIWIGVALSLVGMYLLCIGDDLSIGKGELLCLVCSFFYAVHILVIDHFPDVDGVRMACIQYLVCGFLSLILMFIFDQPSIAALKSAWVTIAYAGIFSCAVAFTLQIEAQKNINPTLASMLMSLESVFSVLSGWVLLGQVMTLKEGIGCVFMFAAVLIAQIPTKEN